MRPFDPGNNATIAEANATSAAGGSLAHSVAVVALYNSSDSATAYFTCAPTNAGGSGPTAVVPSGGTRGAFPVPPGAQVRVSVPRGPKAYSVVASAADGTLFITPGEGS